jgi:signal transduction histidine kinase/ActR/RegA family two-component response regulator
MSDSTPERVLILAPRGRDAQVALQLLTARERPAVTCNSVPHLVQELMQGAGTALVAEEALHGVNLRPLCNWLAEQPPWSDLPFVLLSGKPTLRGPEVADVIIGVLGNVIVLERPISAQSLTSAVDSALRARSRQYQTRKHLQERSTVEQELRSSQQALRQLNETLESRIGARTIDLARANDRLVKEIAERERAQAALVQSQKMEAIGQLTNGIAHDFNNLLTAIVGNVDLIRQRTSDERLKRLAGHAHEAANRASRLTGQLLAFSRTQRLDLKPVNIDELIDGMHDLVRRSIGPSIAIQKELNSSRQHALADANQLELAILNLIINARDAMSEGGTLSILTSVQSSDGDNFVVIAVRDTGAGIAPHLLSKVFEPFFTTKPVGKGTGLGLSQVYGIAEQSGGAAKIASELGKGTTVEIWLPVCAITAPQYAFSMSSDLPLASQLQETILVVEDDRDVRRFIVECLDTLGYHIKEAAHGQQGLELLRAEAPSLLIVDFAMPGMNGAELAARVRADQHVMPIIFVTGYADMDAVDRVSGNNLVLRKPFDVAGLANIVRQALALRIANTSVRPASDSSSVCAI